MASHIVITGPGRSGTTLLVQLLGALGFETGADRLAFSEQAHAGLESDVLADDAPHVVKNPALTWQLRGLIESGRLDPATVEWLIVPLRSLSESAASRVKIAAEQRSVHPSGGLFGTNWPRKQRDWLAEATYGLFETAALFELPLIVLEYPRFARDAAYAARRLKPLLHGRSHVDFEAAWRSVVDPTLVRSGPIEVPPFADATLAAVRLRDWGKRKLAGARRRLR